MYRRCMYTAGFSFACRHIADYVCVGTADGMLVCFEQCEGIYYSALCGLFVKLKLYKLCNIVDQLIDQHQLAYLWLSAKKAL